MCYPEQMKLTWKSFEDFSAIAVDKGMVDDHLPTAVMAGLRRIKRQFIGCRYDPKETERIRLDASEEYREKMAAARRGQSVEREDSSCVSPGWVDEDLVLGNVLSHGSRGNNGATFHNGHGSHRERQTVEVAFEEENSHNPESWPERQRLFGRENHDPPSQGAAATAGAFLQALARERPPSNATSNDIALEMDTIV